MSKRGRFWAGYFAAIALLVGLLTGCASMDVEDRALAGQGADISSTAIGLAVGAAEANPLGIGLLAVKAISYHHIKSAPPEQQPAMWSAFGAMGWGAAVNNVCVIALIVTGGAAVALCPALGLVTGLGTYAHAAPLRERAVFDAVCDAARADRPGLVCVYRPQKLLALAAPRAN
jgi:hypothetical protein